MSEPKIVNLFADCTETEATHTKYYPEMRTTATVQLSFSDGFYSTVIIPNDKLNLVCGETYEIRCEVRLVRKPSVEVKNE